MRPKNWVEEMSAFTPNRQHNSLVGLAGRDDFIRAEVLAPAADAYEVFPRRNFDSLDFPSPDLLQNAQANEANAKKQPKSPLSIERHVCFSLFNFVPIRE